ncbi:hypothetical protein FNW52_16155 [Flavobacterium sp. ZT3R18]|uniref:DUF6520 family protein n=1 Tax=Flavobacterium sp. ZT3R18 TaxID=2594429 RepID=UPI00117B6768|nr:DUF6520 family protein [Flavobacterium sp. ZT3R18]TRX32988.1 hypothetical protein FNW52_16155 [Flavobacterium sp. ZT3R18]
MKTQFLNKMIPFAVVVMGISGAFLTTSMQSDSNSATPRTGYINGPLGACSVPVNCSDIVGPVCRANGATGQQAFGKDSQNNCVELLYRP